MCHYSQVVAVYLVAALSTMNCLRRAVKLSLQVNSELNDCATSDLLQTMISKHTEHVWKGNHSNDFKRRENTSSMVPRALFSHIRQTRLNQAATLLKQALSPLSKSLSNTSLKNTRLCLVLIFGTQEALYSISEHKERSSDNTKSSFLRYSFSHYISAETAQDGSHCTCTMCTELWNLPEALSLRENESQNKGKSNSLSETLLRLLDFQRPWLQILLCLVSICLALSSHGLPCSKIDCLVLTWTALSSTEAHSFSSMCYSSPATVICNIESYLVCLVLYRYKEPAECSCFPLVIEHLLLPTHLGLMKHYKVQKIG